MREWYEFGVRGAALSFVFMSMVSLSGTKVLAADGEEISPHLDVEVSVEFESDHTFRSDDAANKITDNYPSIGIGASWVFNRYFSVNGSFVAEPVVDADPGSTRRFFDDVGIYTEELYAQVQLQNLRLFGGKFDAPFGQAWDLTPGLYGTDFAEDYQLTERVGFGLGYGFGRTFIGDVDFTAGLYTADTSALSGSFFTQRPRKHLSDGGAGNSGDLDSFSVTLDGRNLPGLAGIAWHLGYSHQARGKTATDLHDENGYVGGLYGSHDLGNSLTFNWDAEIARLDHAGGGKDSTTYYTLGGVLTIANKYNLALAHTTRAHDVAGGADYNDSTTQISAGMEVYDGWSLDVGYKIARADHVKSETVGVLLSRSFSFSTGE